LLTAALCVAGLGFFPFLGGTPWLRIATIVALAVAGGVSLWIRSMARDPARYARHGVVIYAIACMGVVFSGSYFTGFFSTTPLLITMGISFFGLGARRLVAIWLPVAVTFAYLALCWLIIVGVLPDAGLFPVRGLPVIVQVFETTMVPIIFLVTLQQARHSRKTTLEAIERANQEHLQVVQREAQLDEANRNLEVALQAGAGQEGRHTGDQAGAYRLGEVLGRGSMGEVYAATHVSTGELAAVKLLRAGAHGDPDLVRRFLREAELAGKLSSRHVVEVREVGQLPGGIPFITMERLSGHDLAWHLRQRALVPLDELIAILVEVAAGLEAGRKAGVVHRDIKPQNLFLADRPGTTPIWKIVDYGVAKLGASSGTLTQHAVVGTPGYMSPEQAQGKSADHRSDLFSLGAVAYRALTGRAPFAGPDLPQILFEVVYRAPPSPRELVPPLPAAVDLVLAIALAKRPEDRFQSAPELVAALVAARKNRIEARLSDHARKLLTQLPWSGGPTP
jgi:serine/threonine-protein kinase